MTRMCTAAAQVATFCPRPTLAAPMKKPVQGTGFLENLRRGRNDPTRERSAANQCWMSFQNSFFSR